MMQKRRQTPAAGCMGLRRRYCAATRTKATRLIEKARISSTLQIVLVH